MSDNSNLCKAKDKRDDEFYTQYAAIEQEIGAYLEHNKDIFRGKTVLCPCDDPDKSNFTKYFVANFGKLGLKKLVSTSYARNSIPVQPDLFSDFAGEACPEADTRGKILELDRGLDLPGDFSVKDLGLTRRLKGNGDFRGGEVSLLRDKADFIITNPPFSLFQDFINWIRLAEGEKKYLVLGHISGATYSTVFPLIKNNEMWLGAYSRNKMHSYFITPDMENAGGADGGTDGMTHIPIYWYTNIKHNIKRPFLKLKTMKENLESSPHQEIRDYGYPRYENYDGIDVPYTDAIPSDYDGCMGVPVTFLDKYNPEQFEIVKFRKGDDDKDLLCYTRLIDGKDGEARKCYPFCRLVIRRRRP